MGSPEIVVSSVRPSVSYFSAAITPRERILNIGQLLYSGQKYGLGFGVSGLGVQESGLDQDPYQKLLQA
jgi:hypothetical protein